MPLFLHEIVMSLESLFRSLGERNSRMPRAGFDPGMEHVKSDLQSINLYKNTTADDSLVNSGLI